METVIISLQFLIFDCWQLLSLTPPSLCPCCCASGQHDKKSWCFLFPSGWENQATQASATHIILTMNPLPNYPRNLKASTLSWATFDLLEGPALFSLDYVKTGTFHPLLVCGQHHQAWHLNCILGSSTLLLGWLQRRQKLGRNMNITKSR